MTVGGFPEGFIWGAATAAYQIEGAAAEGGRARSIWDTFSHTPGMTWNGDTGDVACDHYHRWQDDIRLMRDLGLDAYRFSIAWPRVIPQGSGPVNPVGLDFYDRLVDGLLDAGITPFVTLYHWDLPQALQDRGGWASRETVDAFAEYTDAVVRGLGDRVRHWITHNEPWVAAFVGHLVGRHAPGLHDLPTALLAAHHLLLSHGRAVEVIRGQVSEAEVGITLNLSPAWPASESSEDHTAAWRYDGFHNRWFLDPIFGRGYPADLPELSGELLEQVPLDALGADLEVIASPIDFLGVNYYFPVIARAATVDESVVRAEPLSPEELSRRGYELTDMGWPVEPQGLSELLVRLQRDYMPAAIYITENGAAFPDQLIDGMVNDPQRIAYLRAHLQATLDAISAGAPVRGYFAWSLMDNFEWGYGYSKRFGLVYVDLETQRRIPKASVNWYRNVTAANALES